MFVSTKPSLCHFERFVTPGQTIFWLTAISRLSLAWEGLAQAIAAHDSLWLSGRIGCPGAMRRRVTSGLWKGSVVELAVARRSTQ